MGNFDHFKIEKWNLQNSNRQASTEFAELSILTMSHDVNLQRAILASLQPAPRATQRPAPTAARFSSTFGTYPHHDCSLGYEIN